MAAPKTIQELLKTLTQSLSSALEVTPKIAEIDRPEDGISLLDVKNEILLSYLQNLVFLILLKLRESRSDDDATEENGSLAESVRAKLVELRLYLEKGTRPLEEKLSFSIENFLRAADEAQRKELDQEKRRKARSGSSTSDSDAESQSEDESASDEEDGQMLQDTGDKTARPGMKNMRDDPLASKSSREADGPSGVYRPPKRERQVMETQRREKTDRRPAKSHTMEEFIASELSSAPVAEPSIGTTIVQGGRRTKTATERAKEDERREYEETNFTRLPQETKKDRAKAARQGGRSNRMTFGGEEWHGLGEGVERIDRLTRRKEGGGAGAGVRAMLEKSRKRGPETTDGPRGSGRAGPEIGERYQKRLKTLNGGHKDRRKGR